jgi:hypothetical protein
MGEEYLDEGFEVAEDADDVFFAGSEVCEEQKHKVFGEAIEELGIFLFDAA